MNILFQRSSRGFEASGVLLLACEGGGICAEGGIKLDAFVWEDGGVKSFVQEDGGIKLDASGAIGSKEAYEEAYKDACEDDYKSIRGLFGLPLLLEVANRLPRRCLPLLPAD